MVRTDLATSVLTGGTLGYAPTDPVVNHIGGTYTALPAIGSTIEPGQPLYRVDNLPIVLMIGSTPAYRAFGPGMTDGPDVEQLESNLIALGDAHGLFSAPSGHFSTLTADAVERWQTANGYTADGQIPLGVIVFLPTAVLVGAQSVAPGQPAAPGDSPYQVTTSSRLVYVPLNPDLPTVSVGEPGLDRPALQRPDTGDGDRGRTTATEPGLVLIVVGFRFGHGELLVIDDHGADRHTAGSGGHGHRRRRRRPGLLDDPARPGCAGGPRLGPARPGRGRLRRRNRDLLGVAPAHRRHHRDLRRRTCPGLGARHRPRGHGRGGAVNALELDAVTKEHPGTPPVVALDSVTLTIGQGELVAVVGPSGSGKSTLLAVAGTLERPTSGEIRIGGAAVQDLPDSALSGVRSHQIGFVFQQYFLIPTMTTLDNVANGLLYRGIPAADRRRAAMDAVDGSRPQPSIAPSTG